MQNVIQFDLGDREYVLNDRCTVVFNPTDIAFIERVFGTFDELDKRQEEYNAKISRQEDNAGVFQLARDMDAEMRSMIDAVFEDDVSEPVFGSRNVYAMADGLPIWCNLMLAIIDEMDSAAAREKKATNPRLKKYLEKYNKKK
jgi:hypothetical protein